MTKAYILIVTVAQAERHGYRECIRDLEAIPEVQCVEPVPGQYDLLATVEVRGSALLLADAILAKRWVEHVAICFSPVGSVLRPRAARAGL